MPHSVPGQVAQEITTYDDVPQSDHFEDVRGNVQDALEASNEPVEAEEAPKKKRGGKVDEAKKAASIKAWEDHGKDVTAAAAALGIKRATLYARLRSYKVIKTKARKPGKAQAKSKSKRKTSRKQEHAAHLESRGSNLYQLEAGKHKLLSAEEEKEALLKVHDTREFLELMDSIAHLANGKEEQEFVQIAKQHYDRAKRKLVRANIRFVITIAKKYGWSGLSWDDRMQYGMIGLNKGIDRYEIEKGFRLTTYAGWWIRHSISRGVDDHTRTIRIPVHVRTKLYSIQKLKREMRAKMGREPSQEELVKKAARKLKMNKKQVEKVLDAWKVEAVSFDQPLGEREESASYSDYLPDEHFTPDALYEESAEIRDQYDQINELLGDLCERDRYILKARFFRDLTLKEIGQEYGISRERVRQLQNEALDKIKRGVLRSELIGLFGIYNDETEEPEPETASLGFSPRLGLMDNFPEIDLGVAENTEQEILSKKDIEKTLRARAGSIPLAAKELEVDEKYLKLTIERLGVDLEGIQLKVEEKNRKALSRHLAKHAGDVTQAAEKLKVTEEALLRRIREQGIDLLTIQLEAREAKLNGMSLGQRLTEEREVMRITKAYANAEGEAAEAARTLNISVVDFYRAVKAHVIDLNRIRPHVTEA